MDIADLQFIDHDVAAAPQFEFCAVASRTLSPDMAGGVGKRITKTRKA